MCFSSCLIQGTRYPFVPKVSPSAKQSRCIRKTDTRYESLTATNAAIPRTRTCHKQVADAIYPCPRTVHEHVQSTQTDAGAISPQPRPSNSFNRPQSGSGSEHRLSADSPQPRTVHDRNLAADQHLPRTSTGRTLSEPLHRRVHLPARQFPGSHPNHSSL
jgi:hypothetical protein